jgi:hypothetical protein
LAGSFALTVTDRRATQAAWNMCRAPQLIPGSHYRSTDVPAPPPQDGRTALHLAARQGRIGIIDKLFDMGADINAKGGKEVPSPTPHLSIITESPM